MSSFTYGFTVKREHLTTVETVCNNRNTPYQIWNVEDVFTSDSDAELVFRTEEERRDIHEFYKCLLRTERNFVSLPTRHRR